MSAAMAPISSGGGLACATLAARGRGGLRPLGIPACAEDPRAGAGTVSAGDVVVSPSTGPAGGDAGRADFSEGKAPRRRRITPQMMGVVEDFRAGLSVAATAAKRGLRSTSVRRYATAARAAGIAVPKPDMKRGLDAKMAEVARLYRLRWPPAAIAERLGITPRSVHTYAAALRAAGHDLPRAPATSPACFPARLPLGELGRRHAAGETQQALALRFGVGKGGVSNALRRAAAAGMETGPLGRWPGRAKP